MFQMSVPYSQIISSSTMNSSMLPISGLDTIPGAQLITLDGRTILIYPGLKVTVKDTIKDLDQVVTKEATSKDFNREECTLTQLDSSSKGPTMEFINILMPLETITISISQHNQEIRQHRQDRIRR